MALYDIDEMAQEFEPVRVKFRGEEYTLGDSVHAILSASSVFQQVDAKTDDKTTTLQVFTFLRPIIRVLSPEMGKVMDKQDLNVAEEAAMLRPVTEVLAQVGRLSFRKEE